MLVRTAVFASLAVLLLASASPGQTPPVDAPVQAPADPAQEAWAAGRWEQARQLLEPRVAAGEPLAQVLLGHLYARGLGVQVDPEHALDLFRCAARKDLPSAHRALGWAALVGLGGEPDLERARRAFLRAALLGDAESMVRLATFQSQGWVAPGDKGIAYAWTLLAEERGVVRARALAGLVGRLSPQEVQSGRVRSAELRRLIDALRGRVTDTPVRRYEGVARAQRPGS